jgi:MYXO-CTERM domain-containing protein
VSGTCYVPPMVCGSASLGVLLCLGLAACSGPTPRTVPAATKEGLIGGGSATSEQAVVVLLRENLPACSGTLIAPNLVVTARSCVADLSTGDGPIDCAASTFGAPHDLSTIVLSSAPNGMESFGGETVATEVRVPEGASICGNDIALLILRDPMAAAPIWPRLDPAPQPGEEFTAVGYGPRYVDEIGDAGTPSSTWSRNVAINLTVGCVGPCEGNRATPSEWVSNARVCVGDAGGPALDILKHQLGVASRPEEYCIGGLYTSLSSWVPLIVDAAEDAAVAGGYDPPVWTQTLPDAGTPPDPGVTDGGAGASGETSAGGSSGTSSLPSGGRTSVNGGAGGSPGFGAGAPASGGHSAVGQAGTGATPETPGAAGDAAAEAGAPTTQGGITRPADTARRSGCSCRVADEGSREARVWPVGVLLLAGGACSRRRRRR